MSIFFYRSLLMQDNGSNLYRSVFECEKFSSLMLCLDSWSYTFHPRKCYLLFVFLQLVPNQQEWQKCNYDFREKQTKLKDIQWINI
jgi:hypothetical protein